MESGLGREKSW